MAQCRVEVDAVKSTLELIKPRKTLWIYLTKERIHVHLVVMTIFLKDIAAEGCRLNK